MKREDLNHPYVSGNKWWKLKYNLAEAQRLGKKTLLTFGGAYSNHIYATAAAAKELGHESIGIIRGEETLPLNPTLTFARLCGMRLHYVSREAYRHKHEPAFINELHDRFGDFYLIPEGGTNELAVKGVEEFAQTLGNDFDYLCCAVGTGGTLAGLVRGVGKEKCLLGVSVLKGGDFLVSDIKKYSSIEYGNWSVLTSYHHGGYAKVSGDLRTFIMKAERNWLVLLDKVYTAKLFWAVVEEIKSGAFTRGCTILILHSGGLRSRHKL